MKRILSAILSVAMAASLVACGSSQSHSSAPADTPAPSVPAESAADAPDDKLTFGLVVMSTNSDYWLTLKDGAAESWFLPALPATTLSRDRFRCLKI